ncbi:MAG TPA: hypothetical protein VNH11_24305 [Pirellulales bacterium]|nr:hypothetical protein [Pirellulales bacterium]
MSDSWLRVVPIKTPAPDKNIGHWRAWVEEDWLLVERRTGKGDIEWKIVLAKVVGEEPPEIDADQFGALRLNYDNGRYFIREYSGSDAESDFGCLRCRRQPKMSEERWPTIPAPPRDRKAPAGFSGSRQWSLSSRVSGSWLTVTAGPPGQGGEQRSVDFLLRLYHADLEVDAHGGSGGGDFLRQFYGKWFVEDDGELLVANWLPASLLVEELNQHPLLAGRFATKRLGGSAAPLLAGEVWLNSDRPPTWKTLRGQPVLLVLFDLKQPSFLPLVPPLLGFQEMYGKQGLVVIGVHANDQRDDVAKRLADERITFPVLIDDGKTAERIGIGFSACLLVDREGKVVSAYKDALAPPAEIEKLLGSKRLH